MRTTIFPGILFLIGIVAVKTTTIPPLPPLPTLPPLLPLWPMQPLPTRSAYGETCNHTMRCDPRGWLGCHNGNCDCIKKEEMIYNEEIRKCVTKSGERCSFILDGVEDNDSIFERTSCVDNAYCGFDGICECDSTFYENVNGTCSLARGHGETCDSGSQCSRYQKLYCNNGTCQCDETKSVYLKGSNRIEGQCVGLAGSPCINLLCTKFSSCSKHYTCICDDLHYPDVSGLCLPKIEQLYNCTEDFQCKQKVGQKIVCLNGLCECDPSLSIYSTAQASIKHSERYGWGVSNNPNFHGFTGDSRTQCVGLASSPCIDRLCVPNAFCSYPADQNSQDQQGICKCQSGYTKSRSNTCATGFNSSCTSSSTCIDDLVCRSSQCLCPFITQTFDDLKKTCLSRIGGPCKTDESCQSNAKCAFLSTKRKSPGHCECENGYVENLHGKCQAEFSTTCSSTSDCDQIAALQCIDKKCKCPAFAEYNPKLRKCVGLVGAKCELSEVDENVCVKNSHCSEGSIPQLLGSCTCNPGYEESENYTCIPEGRNDDLNEL